MVLSSYYTVERYNDDCSRNYRARNLDDIRAKLRDNLLRSRFRTRAIKMFQKRRTLTRSISSSLQNYNLIKDLHSCDGSSTSGSSDYEKDFQNDFTPFKVHSNSYYLPTSTPSSSDECDFYQSGLLTPSSESEQEPTSHWLNSAYDTDSNDSNDYTLTTNDETQYFKSDTTLTCQTQPCSRSSTPSSFSSSNIYTCTPMVSTTPSYNAIIPGKDEDFVEIDGCQVPSSFVEANHVRSITSSHHYNNPTRPRMLSIEIHQQAYKQSGLSPRSSASTILDFVKVKSDLEEFTKQIEHLISTSQSNQSNMSNLITNNWQIISNVFQSNNSRLAIDAIELLSNLMNLDLINSSTLCHILQNGFIFSLKSLIDRTLENETVHHVIKILINIIRSSTGILPYMVDLMYHSKLFNSLLTAAFNGPKADILLFVEFYYIISEILMNQIINQSSLGDEQERYQQQQSIVLPEILLRTCAKSETMQNYNPIITLSKCFDPQTISTLINSNLNRNNHRDEELITKTLIILANVIKLAHLNSSILSSTLDDNINFRLSVHQLEEQKSWTIEILNSFHNSNLSNRMTILISALSRLQAMSDSSDQYSQGVGIENVASRTKDQCQQFIEFYNEYYGQLSASFPN